jgi:hypothetical protein
MDAHTLNPFALGYVAEALGTSTDDDGRPLDSRFKASDLTPETLETMAADCSRFAFKFAHLLDECGVSMGEAGMCFWLSRNGHGAGFWDRHPAHRCAAYEREQARAIKSRDFSKREALNRTCPCVYHVCMRLHEEAKAWGEFNVSIGDDERLHGYPIPTLKA